MSKGEKQSWIAFMKKIGCNVAGYRFMTENEKQELAWAVYMQHIWDKFWGKYVLSCSSVQDAIQKELSYIEYRKWSDIVSRLRQTQLT